MLARCLQHETDHTMGTVFGDRLPTKLRKKLTKAHDKVAEDFPPVAGVTGAPTYASSSSPREAVLALAAGDLAAANESPRSS